MEVSTFVRIVDGSKDGFSDGLRLFDGRLLINFVGTLDGKLVGLLFGFDVGIFVGRLVGSEVGTFDGVLL